MQIIAGIDGGGTKTTLLIESIDGSYSEKFEFGPFNLNSIGEEKFVALLEEVFVKIRSIGVCTSLCIGAAGSSNPVMSGFIEQSIDRNLPNAEVMLLGDHEIALYGATDGKSGAIVIAGTGSICTGMNASGEIVRAGGFGHLIDDFGSGYSIGKDGLTAVVQAEDGRGEQTIIREKILEFWNIKTTQELIKKVYETTDKSRIASLSHIVEEAAKQGDRPAIAIIEKNAKDLVELVQAVYRRIVVTDHTKVLSLSLMGGMLTNSTKLREIFVSEMAANCPDIKIANPKRNAVEGAILVARKIAGSHHS